MTRPSAAVGVSLAIAAVLLVGAVLTPSGLGGASSHEAMNGTGGATITSAARPGLGSSISADTDPAPPAPAIDGVATNASCSASSCLLSPLTTTRADDVVVLFFTAWTTTASNPSVGVTATPSDQGLRAFSPRASNVDPATFNITYSEPPYLPPAQPPPPVPLSFFDGWELFAVAPFVLQSEVLTITFSPSVEPGGSALAFAVSGANTTDPFDPDDSLPDVNEGLSNNSTLTSPGTITPSSPGDLVVGLVGLGNVSDLVPETSPESFSPIAMAPTAGTPSLALSPTLGVPGFDVTVTGSGFSGSDTYVSITAPGFPGSGSPPDLCGLSEGTIDAGCTLTVPSGQTSPLLVNATGYAALPPTGPGVDWAVAPLTLVNFSDTAAQGEYLSPAPSGPINVSASWTVGTPGPDFPLVWGLIADALVPAERTVTIVETGLPPGAGWSVYLPSSSTSGTSGAGWSGEITIILPTGTLTPYFVAAASSDYTPSPSGGTLSVTSSDLTLDVTFTYTGDQVAQTTAVGSDPGAVVYDPANQYFYVASAGSDSLSALNATGVLEGTISLADFDGLSDLSPSALAVDGGIVWVAGVSTGGGAGVVSVTGLGMNGGGFSISDLSGSVTGVAANATEVYVEGNGSGTAVLVANCTLTSPTTCGTVTVDTLDDGSPGGLAVDGDGAVWGVQTNGPLATCSLPYGSELWNFSSLQCTALPELTSATSLVFAPVDGGSLYVGGICSSSVETCVSGDAGVAVVQESGAGLDYVTTIDSGIPVVSGTGAPAIAYDSQNDFLYVSLNTGATPGSSGLLILSDATNSPIALSPLPGLPEGVATTTAPASNYVVVAYDPDDTGRVALLSQVYPVVFNESGLPAERSFAVTLHGTTESLTTDGGADLLTFFEANNSVTGTLDYPYSVSFVSGWAPLGGSTGSLSVHGAEVTVPLTFVASLPTLRLTPSTGGDGTLVTASGSGFGHDATVGFTFDGGPVSADCSTGPSGNFPGITGTPCTFEVPNLAPIGDDGGSNVVATTGPSVAAAATYTVVARTLALYPAVGGDGSLVLASGSGFAPRASVAFSFDGVTVASSCSTGPEGYFPGVSGTPCTFDVPAAAPPGDDGGLNVVATTGGPIEASATYTVVARTLTLYPTSGGEGTLVTASGAGFASDAAVTFTFDGVAVASDCSTGPEGYFPGVSGTPCTFDVPATAPPGDDGGLNLVAATGVSITASASYTVVARTLTLYPTSGGDGTLVTASGAGFAPNAAVTFTFDGVAVSSDCSTGPRGYFPGITGTPCTFVVPSSAPTGDDGGSNVVASTGASLGASATYSVVGRTLTLHPTSGPTGTLVTATGSGFAPDATVSFTFDGLTVTSDCSTGPEGYFPGITGTPCTFDVPGPAPIGDDGGSNVVATTGSLAASTSFSVTDPVDLGAFGHVAPTIPTAIVSGTGPAVTPRWT